MIKVGHTLNVEDAPGAEAGLTEWFQCWDTIESLARDASRLYEKCGTSCNLGELREWRDRVLAQLDNALAEEQRIFAEIGPVADSESEVPTAA